MTAPLPDLARHAILLVDDEPDLRQILAEGLEMSGYRVVQAGTGEEALKLAEADAGLRVLVSDVRLPGMSGVELAERVASPLSQRKAILISGYFVPQTIRFSLLNKPFTMRQLEAAIERELAR